MYNTFLLIYPLCLNSININRFFPLIAAVETLSPYLGIHILRPRIVNVLQPWIIYFQPLWTYVSYVFYPITCIFNIVSYGHGVLTLVYYSLVWLFGRQKIGNVIHDYFHKKRFVTNQHELLVILIVITLRCLFYEFSSAFESLCQGIIIVFKLESKPSSNNYAWTSVYSGLWEYVWIILKYFYEFNL
jgi:hypothetical protein